jgi:hypothetical protein
MTTSEGTNARQDAGLKVTRLGVRTKAGAKRSAADGTDGA